MKNPPDARLWVGYKLEWATGLSTTLVGGRRTMSKPRKRDLINGRRVTGGFDLWY